MKFKILISFQVQIVYTDKKKLVNIICNYSSNCELYNEPSTQHIYKPTQQIFHRLQIVHNRQKKHTTLAIPMSMGCHHKRN
jgi:hypothetical protein